MQQDRQQHIVLAKKFPMDYGRWFNTFSSLSKFKSSFCLLESLKAGRYSVAGLNPFATIKGKNGKLTITTNCMTLVKKGNPLTLLKEWMKQYETEKLAAFPEIQGGAIGFISYDYVRNIETLPNKAADDLDTPEIYFLVFNDIFIYDHELKELSIIVREEACNEELAQNRLKKYEDHWLNSNFEPLEAIKTSQAFNVMNKKVSLNEEQFVDAVNKVKDYISAGDVFQVNLSVRVSEPLRVHPFSVYRKLREINPSSYMGYLHFPDMQVVCGSPELLIKKRGAQISTRPIAGTRSRGETEAEDLRLATELIENEKERAEHVMLVDLERNDLGRVSEYGTVQVDEFMVIEKYSHVMHIVSNVVGKLKSENDRYDVINAVFPGGTITGAPKVRTMEIIEELEPVRRGIYTGSIGWLDFSGDLELNIVIRTMVVKDQIAHIQAGAGIVIDSDPVAEYKECLKKAKALWQAKELSENEKIKV